MPCCQQKKMLTCEKNPFSFRSRHVEILAILRPIFSGGHTGSLPRRQAAKTMKTMITYVNRSRFKTFQNAYIISDAKLTAMVDLTL